MTHALAISGLVKTYGSLRALDGLDMQVEPGEVHGFLGPNGAGKSTTVRILLGLLRADAGQVDLLGHDPWHDSLALHRKLAYVHGDVTLWPNLTGGEVIDLIARLRGDIDPARRDDLLERFDLDPTKKGRSYSKGNRQKVALVAALAADAEMYILDEPTSGLDPLREVVFRECVAELRADGRTVLLSSHILSEVERLADRVTIIRDGRVVEAGTLADLRHLTRTTIEVETTEPARRLADLEGVHDLTATDGRVQFDVDTVQLTPVLEELSRLGVQALTSHPPTLEELFMRHYGSSDDPAGNATAGNATAGNATAGNATAEDTTDDPTREVTG